MEQLCHKPGGLLVTETLLLMIVLGIHVYHHDVYTYIILVLMIWFCLVWCHFEAMSFSPFSGLSRHRENREFESPFFRT